LIIYRAISNAEKEDLDLHKEFKLKPGAYEAKLFAESDDDAGVFGKNFYRYDNEPFFVVKVTIDDDFSKQFAIENPDVELGVGATIVIDRDQLEVFNLYMEYEILNNVACRKIF
jgi:hypothetical protein